MVTPYSDPIQMYRYKVEARQKQMHTFVKVTEPDT